MRFESEAAAQGNVEMFWFGLMVYLMAAEGDKEALVMRLSMWNAMTNVSRVRTESPSLEVSYFAVVSRSVVRESSMAESLAPCDANAMSTAQTNFLEVESH